jgi:Zn-dependent M28 family amino/carboxypeptidase
MTFFIRTLIVTLILLIGAVMMMTQPFVSTVYRITKMNTTIEESKLKAHVRFLSQDVYPRSFDHASKLDAAASYIKRELEAAGATVTEQAVIVQGEKFRNLIARFNPKNTPKDGALLVIGAHYDAHGDSIDASKAGKSATPQSQTPGADDNASGVAGLIELTRLLAKSPPSRPVELVAYTLEEPPNFRTPHMGSAWHAKRLLEAKQPIELMISLEMIGYFSDVQGSQSYPFPGMNLFYPSKGNYVSLVSRPKDWQHTRKLKALMAGATELPVYSINAPAFIPGIDFSDHLNYWKHDMPAVMITDTAFHRNKEYHQSGDTYERLDYRRMAQVVQGVYAYCMMP